MNDSGAFLARSQKHWQRGEEEGIDEDDVGREATQGHLQSGGLSREEPSKIVFEVEADHLETGRFVLPLGKLCEVLVHI
jgi:hypothetical protein